MGIQGINPALAILIAAGRNLDSENRMKGADEVTSVTLAQQEIAGYQAAYAPCSIDPKTGLPNHDGGQLSYDTDMVTYWANQLKNQTDSKIIEHDQAELTAAQATYRADSTAQSALMGAMDSATQKEEASVTSDDTNLTQMTKQAQMMVSLCMFIIGLLSHRL